MPLSDSLVLSSSDAVPEVPPGSLIDLIYENFDSFPSDKIALIDDASGRSFTFHELKRATEKVASGLCKRGFGKGHVLSLVATNCIENVPIAHGTIAAGGTLQLLKPSVSHEELQFYFGLAQPQIIVTTNPDAVQDAVRSAALNVQDIYVIGDNAEGCRSAGELLEDKGDANPWGRVKINPREDVAVMLLTGGTTGMSKTVLATHDACKQGVLVGAELISESAQDLSLGYIPFSHSYSFCVLYGHWLRLGCGVLNINTYDPKALLDAIERHRITQVAITPTAILSLVDCERFKKTNFSSLKRFLVAGAAMSGETEEHIDQAIQKTCPSVVLNQAYGATEMVGLISRYPSSETNQNYKRKFGSTGLLCPTFEMVVLSCDASQKHCGPGQFGEVRLRQTRFTKGYLKNEEDSRDAIDGDGWYRTGDYGYFDEGGHIFIVDRISDLIQHKKAVILPSSIEGVLRSHPGIKDCAVIGCQSENGGEVPMAFIVRGEGCDLTAEAVQSFGAERLSPHEQLLGGVRFVNNIPKSPAGKMLRRALRDGL